MKLATIALVIHPDPTNPVITEILSDEGEIEIFETHRQAGDPDPLAKVHAHRQAQAQQDDDFGNYVEELLSRPFIRKEIRDHGVQWLRSKIRIEEYQRNEMEAARVIADFAFRVFVGDPSKTDFMLAGPHTQVRVRILPLPTATVEKQAA
ncbi:MAG: hypothetical protein ACXWPM_09990 [Bdellovibrionota bacterium]